jgi:arylsulfatase A-like enzyme
VLKAKRADSAQQLGLVPNGAQTPPRVEALKPWVDLTEEERAVSKKGMEVYAGVVENMDYHYGRVVDFLKDIGEYDNTIIIFLSDNGSSPLVSEDYPGNRGSKWLAQFDNSVENIGHPMSHYAYGMGWGGCRHRPT